MDTFTAWYLNEVATPDMIRAAAIVQRYCDVQLERIFRRLGLERRLGSPTSAAALASELDFEASAEVALEAMLARLSKSSDCVRQMGDHVFKTFQSLAPPEPDIAELDDLRRELRGIDQAFLSAVDFLDYGAEHFAEALGTSPDLIDAMLSGRSRDPKVADLWHRATNTDPLQDCHGRIGAVALLETFSGGTILEIGGGTGNGLRHVLGAFTAAGAVDRIDSYIFTDISLAFTNVTRREMKKAYPEAPLRWQFLDINRPLSEQKIAPASIDLIYGVNAAHVAKDLLSFLSSCLEALRVGGRVVFSERMRRRPDEMAPRELTLNLSAYHRGAARRNEDYRPMHCYLSPCHWLRVFELAGLEDGRILPDLDIVNERFPDAYAAVATAIKRG